jgi:hypothetical protein
MEDGRGKQKKDSRDVGDGWAERTISQPDFGRSVNPLSVKGADCVPPKENTECFTSLKRKERQEFC